MFLGIDGFRRGWVAAWVDRSGNHGWDHSPTLKRLLDRAYDLAMIDVPIGLPDSGYRDCDVQARKLVGPCVFLGARRDMLAFETQAEATEHYHSRGEPGVSCQLWGIRNKIGEVDAVMTPVLQQTLRECHPELVFWRLNGQRRLSNKKTQTGRSQRIAILRDQGFAAIDQWLGRRRSTSVGRDDLIDACACAVAAKAAKSRIPEAADSGCSIDGRGLRMSIWY